MRIKSFNKGEVIFREGEYSASMYQINSGTVGIFSAYQTEDEKELTKLGSEAFFGEMGIVECYPRSATAVALVDGTEVTEITERELSDYLRNKPDVMLEIMKQLSARLREVTASYEEACRTVYESREAETKGEKKSEGLLSRIMHFFSEYGRLTRS